MGSNVSSLSYAIANPNASDVATGGQTITANSATARPKMMKQGTLPKYQQSDLTQQH
ncbi:MAG: hypothetical protein AB1589_41130 [Cyanobacteriota bacterium]